MLHKSPKRRIDQVVNLGAQPLDAEVWEPRMYCTEIPWLVGGLEHFFNNDLYLGNYNGLE